MLCLLLHLALWGPLLSLLQLLVVHCSTWCAAAAAAAVTAAATGGSLLPAALSAPRFAWWWIWGPWWARQSPSSPQQTVSTHTSVSLVTPGAGYTSVGDTRHACGWLLPEAEVDHFITASRSTNSIKRCDDIYQLLPAYACVVKAAHSVTVSPE
jgi:hypothetical protein